MFKVFWTFGVSGKEWQVDVGRSGRRKFLLGFFSFVLHTLHSGGIVFDIDTGFFLEFINEVVNDDVIEVFTTKVGITVG